MEELIQMGTWCLWSYPLLKTLFGPRCYGAGEMHSRCSSGYPPQAHGQRRGSRRRCQCQMADAGLPEAGLQTAHPCDLSMGQLLLKESEVIKVPIFTLPKHSDKPAWSMGYPMSCFFANILSMSETLHKPAIMWKLRHGAITQPNTTGKHLNSQKHLQASTKQLKRAIKTSTTQSQTPNSPKK